MRDRPPGPTQLPDKLLRLASSKLARESRSSPYRFVIIVSGVGVIDEIAADFFDDQAAMRHGTLLLEQVDRVCIYYNGLLLSDLVA